MSYDCVYANKIKNRETGNELNIVLEKLNDEECELLASYVLKAYSGGIFDTLVNLEGLHEYANMKVRFNGLLLPKETFHGIVSDYMEHYQNKTWLKK